MSTEIDMAELSLATGLQLLYDDGVLPPNLSRQALAFATPEQAFRLGTDGFAMNRAATLMAMESPSSNVELSSTALESLVQDLAAPEPSGPKSQSSAAPSEGSGYPYGGWASNLGHQISPELATSAPSASLPAGTSTAINVLA